MQLFFQNPGQSVSDFSVSGNVVSIGTLTIDCATYQKDSQERVVVRAGLNGSPVIGGQGAFIAVITIPPKRYEIVEDVPTVLPLDRKSVV